jgi:hypothetical protein
MFNRISFEIETGTGLTVSRREMWVIEICAFRRVEKRWHLVTRTSDKAQAEMIASRVKMPRLKVRIRRWRGRIDPVGVRIDKLLNDSMGKP